MQLSAGAGPRGCCLLSPPHAQPWLPHCCSLPTPTSGSCAGDGHTGSCLSVLKRNCFWPQGVMVAESKSGPLPLQEDENKMSIVCLRAQGAARHCSEMWHGSAASQCHLCVGKPWSESLYPFFCILGCPSLAAWNSVPMSWSLVLPEKENHLVASPEDGVWIDTLLRDTQETSSRTTVLSKSAVPILTLIHINDFNRRYCWLGRSWKLSRPLFWTLAQNLFL